MKTKIIVYVIGFCFVLPLACWNIKQYQPVVHAQSSYAPPTHGDMVELIKAIDRLTDAVKSRR